MVERADGDPPGQINFDLEEALELLAALEDSREILVESDHLSVLAKSSTRSSGSAVHSDSIKEGSVDTDILRASDAARRLDISTKELLRLVHDRKIRYVMVDGIAHIPLDALHEYQTRAS